jgi:hypothetical protein
MSMAYKEVPVKIKKSKLMEIGSLSGKDYSSLIEYEEHIPLKEMVTYNVGDSFLSTDFLPEEVCNKYRFIKTGNLFEHRLLVDYTQTEYCKPVGNDILEDGDILIAKDGNGTGLGEVSIYFKDYNFEKDYICGEILKIRVNPEYDKWYLIGMLKSNYFKEYLDVVTPGGSTLRHSKLLSLDFKVPFPKNKKVEMEYISLLVQNLVNKEIQLNKKRNRINSIISNELHENCNWDNIAKYKQPTIKKIKADGRIDTGIYSEEYVKLEQMIKNHKNGYYHLEKSSVSPGRTPKDYIYTDEKRKNTYLWITPKNINSLELSYETFVYTQDSTKVKGHDIILSGIRYLGYGFFVEKDTTVYCNQNTLVVSQSKDRNEQIFLLAFFTSSIGKELQFAWRVDGLVPIIYKDDFMKIPIPDFRQEKRNEIVDLYYKDEYFQGENIPIANYLTEAKKRNKNLGIYQLNIEILSLKKRIQDVVDSFIRNEEIQINWHK